MHLPLTPIRCLARARDLYGHALAVVSGHDRFTYAQMAERCQRFAYALVALGIEPGDRVAFLSFNSHVLLESYFAVPMVKAVLMPLNVRLHPAELAAILEHAEPRALFYESEFAPLIDSLRPAAPGCRFYCIDSESPTDGSYQELMKSPPLAWPQLESFDENSIAELFYTSGTTGRPKGVMLSHRTLYLHALGLAGTLNNSDQEVVLHTIPLFHANGWGYPHFSTFCGRKQVMVRRFEPNAVLALVQQESATAMILVPTMAAALLQCPDRQKYDSSSLRQIMLGGAAASKPLFRALEQGFPGCEILAGYGLTEAAPVLSTARYKRTFPQRTESERIQFAVSAGWPMLGVEMRVVNEDLQDVPQDCCSVGEVIARADTVMDGYYKEPELTRQALCDRWLHTGDLAVWDTEGCIQIVDRKKDIIISGGENIASLEIEEVILAHPAVAECAVVSAPDEKWGEVPAAVLTFKPGAAASKEEILAFAAMHLAKFKLPSIVSFENAPLPKSGTGKIMKTLIRERFWAGKQKRVQG